MADFSQILATRPDFDDSDREWLHHLVADWQVIADLSFADLLLILQKGDGSYIFAEQCRPSTVVSMRVDDVVGQQVDAWMRNECEAAMQHDGVYRSQNLQHIDGMNICNTYAPIRHNGKTLGLVLRETNLENRESNGRYEWESLEVGRQLFAMITREQFPYRDAVMNQRHNARVSDGFMRLTVDGDVTYASPNAISCFRRLGMVDMMQGKNLGEVGAGLIHQNDPVPESLPLVLLGKAPVDSELNANHSVVSIRSMPLMDGHGRTGAIVLCRDITELRRREVELQTKDATISEIHHRVKNNLQAVSALLRLQARKTKSQEVKKELQEAMRRVQTIAMVHEGLSQTADENVDFDKVISNLLRMSVDLASMRTNTSPSTSWANSARCPRRTPPRCRWCSPNSLRMPWNMVTMGARRGTSPYRWGVRANVLMSWWKTMATACTRRRATAWPRPQDQALARRSLTLSSPTTSVAMCAGNMGVMVAPE